MLRVDVKELDQKRTCPQYINGPSNLEYSISFLFCILQNNTQIIIPFDYDIKAIEMYQMKTINLEQLNLKNPD